MSNHLVMESYTVERPTCGEYRIIRPSSNVTLWRVVERPSGRVIRRGLSGTKALALIERLEREQERKR